MNILKTFFYYLLSFWVSEAVSKSSLDLFDVSVSAGTWSTSSFSFSRPVELTDLGGSFFLDVVVTSTGGSAQSVGVVVSFPETGGTLSHFLKFFLKICKFDLRL